MRRAIPRSARPGNARPPSTKDRAVEQRRFLEAIAPASHFHRVFDGLDDVLFFARNLAGELLFFSRGSQTPDGPVQQGPHAESDDDISPRIGPAAQQRATDREVIASRKPVVGHVELWFDEVGLPDWYETNTFPVFDRKGAVIGVMGTLRRFRGTAPSGIGCLRLAPALALLGSDLRGFPPLERLAAACRMSPRNLQRAFHDVFGFGPRTYWMKARIREACAALRTGGRSQTEVAMTLGFCDQSNFSQHFHRHTGLTPSAYVKRCLPTKRNTP